MIEKVSKTSNEIIPLIENSYRLIVYVQLINTAVSDHYATNQVDLLPDFVDQYEQASQNYQRSFLEIQKVAEGKAALNDLLVEANQLVIATTEIADRQLDIHEQFLINEAHFLSERQVFDSRFITYSNDKSNFSRKYNLDDNYSLKTDVNRVIKGIEFVRSAILGFDKNKTQEQLDFIYGQLRAEIKKVDRRMNTILDQSPNLHRELNIYVDALKYSLNSENGLLSLTKSISSLSEISKQNLEVIRSQLAQSIAVFNTLVDQVSMSSDKNTIEINNTSRTVLNTIQIIFVASLLLTCVIVYNQILSIRRPLKSITHSLVEIGKGNLAFKASIDRENEFGDISRGIDKLRVQLGEVLLDIRDSAEEITNSSSKAMQKAAETANIIDQQNDQADNVASLTQEMENSSNDVSQVIELTVKDIEKVSASASSSRESMDHNIESVTTLSEQLVNATSVINQLQQETENIGGILEVISGIADQTNLLALNAAIEAARAGEHGRGFSVVADEVRNLATKTQSSTQEIYAMIEVFKKKSDEAVMMMAANEKNVEKVVQESEKNRGHIEKIFESLDHITQRNGDVSQLVGSQKSLASRVSGDLSTIVEMSETLHVNAEANRLMFDKLVVMAQSQETLTKKFTF